MPATILDTCIELARIAIPPLFLYLGAIQVARINADSKRSQVGVVGEEEAKNQVSPRPPVGN
jgi:hypothetical protein